MSKLAQKLQGKFVPYPISNFYFLQQRLWNKKNPWVFIGSEVIFPIQSKVLGTSLELKQGTVINGPMTIKGSSNVTIGKYCGIAENLYIISSNHVFNKADIGGKFSSDVDTSKGPVYIGNNVWIGDNVTILSGVTIGDGAVIGAGSIVTKDISPFGIAVGSPAKTIKYRFSPKVIKLLLKLGWWHWSKRTLEANKDFFSGVIKNQNVNSLISNLKFDNEKDILKVDFKKNSSTDYLLDGWGPKETNFRWTLNNTSAFILKIKNPKKYKYLKIYGKSFYKSQNIYISVNDSKRTKMLLKAELNEMRIPIKNLIKGVNIFRLYFSKSYSPSSITNSKDSRNLYCQFYYFNLK